MFVKFILLFEHENCLSSKKRDFKPYSVNHLQNCIDIVTYFCVSFNIRMLGMLEIFEGLSESDRFQNNNQQCHCSLLISSLNHNCATTSVKF